MAGSPGQFYTINGIKVQFPCKAYPSQLSMMDKIIKGLERCQNCLLESPTGSGKSLALLCSALAWQAHEKEKMETEEECKKDSCCSCGAKSPLVVDNGGQSSHHPSTNQMPPLQTPRRPDAFSGIPDIEDADFKVQTKKIKGLKMVPTPATPQTSWNMEVQTPVQLTCQQSVCDCQCDKPTSGAGKKRVPKIYFGTRTHKQIAQIARELGKTAYRHTRMTILGSREHTCIDPEVSRGPNKSEECKNKRDGPGCRFHDRVRKISHRSIQDNGLQSAWDLQEFIGLCEKFKACPYFGSRQLKEGADIVFCPYNYLIDPLVRESMEINLNGQIVILDEAHNIEDSTRDAASYSVTQAKVRDALKDIHDMINENIKPTEHRQLHNMLSSFNEFIVRNEDSLDGEYENASRVWTGMDIVATLKHTGVGPDHLADLKKCFNAVTEDDEDHHTDIKLKAATTQCMTGFFMVLDYIYRSNMKYLDDYRIAIVRSMVFTHNNDDAEDGVWRKRKRRGKGQLTRCYTLHFWCLNPAVAFSDINEGARSIVLTSGTLSPMNTFQSELSAPFPIQLEANHVIGNGQVWVGTVSKGPRGGSLLGSYQNSETYAYQDEIGDVVLKVCQTIPHGVLCFLPSYKSMEKLTNRWKNTGVWERLLQHKMVMIEPRASEKIDFDSLIKQYYDVIKAHEHQDAECDGVTGALFFAVCRGKVSEGLDFADNNARAVITVGIPFPSIKDTQVELKKQYNDQHSASRGLLRGRDWYEIQAYRAINQALGRCIRHRNDWGALILLDERYGKNPQRYIKGLSKWIRQRVQYYSTFQQAENALKSFTKERLDNPAIVNSSVLCESPVSNSTTPCIPPPLHTPNLLNKSDHQTSMMTTPLQQVTTANQYTPVAANQHTPAAANQQSDPKAKQMLRSFIPIPGADGKQTTLVVDHPLGTVPVILGGNVVIVPESQIQKQSQQEQLHPNTEKPVLHPTKLPQRFVNQSQAGGFLPSQSVNHTQADPQTPAAKQAVTQNQANNLTVMQTPGQSQAVPLTQIQAGHQTQANTDTLEGEDLILDFNPAMASTQIPTTQSHVGVTPVKLPSAMLDLTPHGVSKQPNQTVFKTPIGKLQFDTQQTKGKRKLITQDTPSVSRDSSVKAAEKSNPLYKFVAIPNEVNTSNAGMEKSRSDSPSLFESDDEADHKMVEKQIGDVLFELGSATEETQAGEADMKSMSPNENLAPVTAPVVSRKPLFKKQTSVKSESTDSEISLNKPSTGKKLSRSRLSRSSVSKLDLNVTASVEDLVITAKPVVLQEQEHNAVKCDLNNDIPEVKVTGSIVDEEILNTKRVSRNKRMRSGQNNVRMTSKKCRKGVDFDDEEEEKDEKIVNQAKELAIICPKCRAKIAKFSDYASESYRPGFIQAMKRPKEPSPVGDLITVDVSQLPQKGLRIMNTDGPELNSYWSAEDQCVVQFMSCENCMDSMRRPSKTGGPPCIAAHVLIIRKHNPRLKEGQVWLLPQCFKV